MMRLDSRIRAVLVMAVAAALLGLGAAAGWEAVRAQSQGHTHSHGTADKGGWLVRLGPDARAAAIERQFRGIETSMAEVAYRYTEMYFGALDGNWAYAQHMAHTMGEALTAGLERSLHGLPRSGGASLHQDRRAHRAAEPGRERVSLGSGLTFRHFHPLRVSKRDGNVGM